MRKNIWCVLFVLWLFPVLYAVAKPNVVIIIADDLGWADVSYHDGRVATPNIDRLAKEGVELDRFYVAPMCSPTRAGLMTGRYPIRFGMARAVIPPHRDYGLPVAERTLPEALAEAGYKHRGIFGKWHLGHRQSKWHPLAQGFTHFEGHYNGMIDFFTQVRDGERDWHINYEPAHERKGYATDLIADAAAAFIRKVAKEEAPYFCYVPFNAPHSPFQAKEEDLARFADDVGDRKRVEKILRAMIWSMDEGIGRILRAIDESGEARDTQVWFMSDNGGIRQVKRNNLPLKGNKLTVYEGGVRVPACVRWPAGWEGGRKVANTMGYIDVFPTVLESAGLDPMKGVVEGRALDGVSLHDLLRGKVSRIEEREWYSYHGQTGPDKEKIAVKTPEWKLVVEGPDVRAGVTGNHLVELYKMPSDLLEREDLAKKHPEVVRGLVKKLVAYRALQPADGVPVYAEGRKGFVPPKDWRVRK